MNNQPLSIAERRTRLRISGFILFLLISYLLPAQPARLSAPVRIDGPGGRDIQFTSSNLPIVVIDTYGQNIPDDVKIPVDFGIIDNGPGIRNNVMDPYAYSGKTGIEVRGSSSQSFPKKSYGFETWNMLGEEIDTSLLGMPAESDWILNANYTDKTFCRNVLAYQTFMDMGHYATRYRFTELVLNGSYMGIYILSEKIKRDNDRVDIAKLLPEDISGDQLTGGYIFKIDKTTGSGGEGWYSRFDPPVHPYGQKIFFQYEYPKPDVIMPEQKDYIQAYMDDFEETLKGPLFADPEQGFRKYANEGSFQDFFIVNEISKNVDGYRLSTFIHKDRDSLGGKITMGPVWDYDIAFHNANYCDGDLSTGWAYQFPCDGDWWQVPFWWSRLLEDATYAGNLKCRWQTLRTDLLSYTHVDGFIDSVATLLDEAQVRNFTKWPILGQYVWPNPYPYPATYAEEITSLKSWLHMRLMWIDYNLPGTCVPVSSAELAEAGSPFRVYPNPARDMLSLEFTPAGTADLSIEILNASGSSLRQMNCGTCGAGLTREVLDVSSLAPGMYVVHIRHGNESRCSRFVKL